MKTKMKFVAIGSAGVVALAGAGLYAGVLTTTTAGKVGAGTVALQSTCATAAVITPGPATWNETAKDYTYTVLNVAYTEADAGACVGQKATANVYLVSSGVESSTNVTPHTILVGEEEGFQITLDTAVPASIDNTLNNYGLVIQSA